jgi:predicted phage baseplate assembly protein
LAVDDDHRFRPRLRDAGIACQGRVTRADGTFVAFDGDAPAAHALVTDPRTAVPAVYLRETTGTNVRWSAQPDLLDTDGFDREFVAEIEDDGSTVLRFGDNVHGALPRAGARFAASYRIGGGRGGNVGANAIAHIVSMEGGIAGVRNPLPARGGQDPERAEHVRLYAPQAFRTQERAVTEADYSAAAERHPAVQRAAATFRWTGSWHTVFLTVDRRGGLPVDAAFEDDLTLFLERFPLAGYDIEIEPPIFVPLDIALTVCVESGVLRSDVHLALLDTFSSRTLPGERRGFFHPDHFTFGQPVYLSRIVAAAMAVPGVRWVDVDHTPPKQNRFHRFGRSPAGEVGAGVLHTARLEIARLDNDPSLPENGRIEFFMEGGL